jgi:protein-disulfide isomerase
VPLLEQVLEQNPKTVKVVFKNFPIRSHKFAVPAAVAALAADRQGKFWHFHDELFKHYNRLNEDKIQEIATQLKLNKTQFEKDRKDPQLMEQIRRDYNEGIRIGIRSVPSVFINGRILKQRSLDGFQALIDKELEILKQKK